MKIWKSLDMNGKNGYAGSGNETQAYHVVSAWVREQGISLGELQVGEETNEITEGPKLLDLLDIRGDVVTADAMSCQKDIAAKIINEGTDHILALKGNQPTMEAEVKAYFDDLPQDRIEMSKTATWTSDASHARKDNSPLNLNVLRKTSLPFLKSVNLEKRISLKKRRYMAALNPDILLRFLTKICLPIGSLFFDYRLNICYN